MQLDAILEVAIGLVVMWLVLSLATMEIQNWFKQVFNIRAKHLENAILEMFKGEQNLVDLFYNHPAIKELCKKDRKSNFIKPSYIPSDVFAQVTMELLVNESQQRQSTTPNTISFSNMVNGVQQVKALNPELEELLTFLFPGMDQAEAGTFSVKDVRGKLKRYQENVENWFDNNMVKASVWYKENALALAFFIGLVLSVVFNIDTINISQKLWREPTMRQALVAQADTYELDEGEANITEVPGYFDSLAIPVGWVTVPTDDPSLCNNLVTAEGQFAILSGTECSILVNVPLLNDYMGWVMKLIGFLISALAARQGAPFWFDLLHRLVGIRDASQTKKKTA